MACRLRRVVDGGAGGAQIYIRQGHVLHLHRARSTRSQYHTHLRTAVRARVGAKTGGGWEKVVGVGSKLGGSGTVGGEFKSTQEGLGVELKSTTGVGEGGRQQVVLEKAAQIQVHTVARRGWERVADNKDCKVFCASEAISHASKRRPRLISAEDCDPFSPFDLYGWLHHPPTLRPRDPERCSPSRPLFIEAHMEHMLVQDSGCTE